MDLKPNKHLVTTYRPKLILVLGMLLFISFGTKLDAQYFSKEYAMYGPSNGYISSIQVVNDTIYAMEGFLDTIYPFSPIAAFGRFDKNGNSISKSLINIPNTRSIGGSWNNLIRTNDGGFAYGGNTTDTSQAENSILILKYDANGNFQWYKQIRGSNYYNFYCDAFIQDSFSNYYLTGTYALSSDQNMYLAKTDSLGNIIYMKEIPHPHYDDAAYGICINKKGNVVLGGDALSYDYTNLNTLKDYTEIYELDTAGNILNYVLGTDSNGPQGYNILTSSDEGYLIASTYICHRDSNNAQWQACLAKLDSNYHELWKIDVGPCSQNTQFNAQKMCLDGNYIAIGQCYDLNYVHINGWVVKYSQNGQILWSKEYRRATDVGINGDFNGLFSLAFMSDSTIVCAGDATNNDDTIPPRQRGWLLHLDTAGCLPDSNSCGIVNGISDISPNAIKLIVYPNPADDIININYALSTAAEQAKIIIVNPLGQQLYDGSMTNTSGIKTINTKSWPQGMYFYTVQSDKGFETSGSFVVHH